jgi:hypothetical protein
MIVSLPGGLNKNVLSLSEKARTKCVLDNYSLTLLPADWAHWPL